MNIKINSKDRGNRKRILDTETILKYLIGGDDQLETSIMCNPEQERLVTTDKNVYEALGSLKDSDDVKTNKITKFFEMVDIISHRRANQKKEILTEDRVEELRQQVFSEISQDRGDI